MKLWTGQLSFPSILMHLSFLSIAALGLFSTHAAAAPEPWVHRLFKVDSKTCEAAQKQYKEYINTLPVLPRYKDVVVRPVVQAHQILQRAIVAANSLANPGREMQLRSDQVLHTRLNAAHMTWGLRPPELYGQIDSAVEPEGLARIGNARERLKHAENFFFGVPVDNRQLTPETATLACSKDAYALAEWAFQIDRRVKWGVSTKAAFGVEELYYLKDQSGVYLNGMKVLNMVIPGPLLCPVTCAPRPPTFTTTYTTHGVNYKPKGEHLIDGIKEEELEDYPKPTTQVREPEDGPQPYRCQPLVTTPSLPALPNIYVYLGDGATYPNANGW